LEKEHSHPPPSLLLELEEKINHFEEKTLALKETLRSFQDLLMFELPEKVQVTLDPTTAHPQLLVSADGRSLRWEEAQEAPFDHPGWATQPYVLAHQGITSGRCCWEVEVTPEGSWALGVAQETSKRMEEATTTPPEMELWSLGLCEGQFWAVTSFQTVPLSHLQVPRRLRVTLDYQKGLVAFFDADKKVLMFSFPPASFQGEKVRPWFLVWNEGAQVTLCP
ncbi:PREDICTED: tripartite motif-containing protein 7-like, partial [Chaetura pelagica]|uniref:tripartite motif-containing protein 7-like n=1 Tax=Chaetura pelagica TaxID=8897 RepID=UPI00052313F6